MSTILAHAEGCHCSTCEFERHPALFLLVVGVFMVVVAIVCWVESKRG